MSSRIRAGVAVRTGLRMALAMLAPFALGGCLAAIHEERGYGPSHPAFEAAVAVHDERRDGEAGPECRTVTATRMVREVDVHRTFADPGPFSAQATNAGLAGVLGAAAVLIGYDLSTLTCSQNNDTGCSGQLQSGAAHAEMLAVGLAVVPTAFLVINALRVQDGRYVESLKPEVTQTDWVPCSP